MIEAARHWAGELPERFAADDNLLQGPEALEAPEDVLDEARRGMMAAQDTETFGVWQDNWPVFKWFARRLVGQWRYLALPMDAPLRLGLDYAAVEAALRMRHAQV